MWWKVVDSPQVWHPKWELLSMIYLESFLDADWNPSILTKCQSFRLGNHMAHLPQEKNWWSLRFGSIIDICSPERTAQTGHFLPCSRRKVTGPSSGPGFIKHALWYRKVRSVNSSFNLFSKIATILECVYFVVLPLWSPADFISTGFWKSLTWTYFSYVQDLITVGSHLRNVLMAISQHT